MMMPTDILNGLLRDDEGATAVEYGLIVSLIIIAMIVTLQDFANSAIDMWGYVEEKVATA